MKFDATKLQKEDLGQFFELFVPDIKSTEELEKWSKIARDYKVRSFMMHAMWIPEAVKLLEGTGIKIGTGTSFPMGTDLPEVKALAAKMAVDLGVTTFDCSMNYRAIWAGREDIVNKEMQLVREATKDIECKFIIECGFLSDEQVALASKLCAENGIDWVKTASGVFQGPNMDQIKIILDTLEGTKTRCKVSGVKYPRPQNAYAFLQAGVEIIGTQGVVEVIESFDLFRQLGLLPAYTG